MQKNILRLTNCRIEIKTGSTSEIRAVRAVTALSIVHFYRRLNSLANRTRITGGGLSTSEIEKYPQCRNAKIDCPISASTRCFRASGTDVLFIKVIFEMSLRVRKWHRKDFTGEKNTSREGRTLRECCG